MATFEFDPHKSFDGNLEAFKAHASELDPECAAVLFDKLSVLVGDGDAARARARRTEFNATVIEALEALPDEGHNNP